MKKQIIQIVRPLYLSYLFSLFGILISLISSNIVISVFYSIALFFNGISATIAIATMVSVHGKVNKSLKNKKIITFISLFFLSCIAVLISLFFFTYHFFIFGIIFLAVYLTLNILIAIISVTHIIKLQSTDM